MSARHRAAEAPRIPPERHTASEPRVQATNTGVERALDLTYIFPLWVELAWLLVPIGLHAREMPRVLTAS